MGLMAGAFRVSSDLTLNFFTALGRPHDDAVGAQLLFVIGKAGNADLLCAEEAVANRDVSRGETAKGKFQRLAIEHADQPANRANEAGT